MADFPLSQYPLYPLNESYAENVISIQAESGYKQSRARFTRARRQWDNVTYMVSSTNKGILQSFYSTTIGYGADAFDWNPDAATTYSVTLNGPMKFEYISPDIWQVTMSLEQV